MRDLAPGLLALALATAGCRAELPTLPPVPQDPGTPFIRPAGVVDGASGPATADATGVDDVAAIPATVKYDWADEPRHALVIGNANYETSRLRNPENDAKSVAAALEKLGFEVTLVLNADQKAMKRAIDDFGRSLAAGGAGLFYYAGHGMQVNGENYLIPVGAVIQREDDIDIESVSLKRVLTRLDGAGNRVNMVILDACRDNPFARSFRSTARGLALADAPTGTMIAYATSPGATAADGDGSNSPFAAALVEHMDEPGWAIEKVLKTVRKDVREATDGAQVPWDSSSLEGEFIFVPPEGS